MSYVFDSSSLIYFGKLKILEKLDIINGTKYIPNNVYREVIKRGFERGDAETNYVKESIEKNLFVIMDAKENIINNGLLSEADKEVLSLSKETKSMAIIDDQYAKQIANSSGIECHGSLYIIMKLVEARKISTIEAVNYIDKMVQLGFYLSVKKYKEVVEIIKNIKLDK